MTSRFVFIESNTTGSGGLFVRTASALGLQPVVVCRDPARYPFLSTDGVLTVHADTGDIGALHTALQRLGRASIAGIVSTSEYFVATAARLAADLGLPGADPRAIRTCRHKGLQRDALSSVVAVPAHRCVTSVGEIAAAFDQVSAPWVVKPAAGSGSVGVRLHHSREGAQAHVEELLQRTVNERGEPEPRDVMIEEYVRGLEYSVEVLCGRALGITAKHLSAEPFFVETGHDFPAPLPARAAAGLTEMAERAVAAVGLRAGPAHVELRLTESGPVVIEVNPRLAGGMIPELMRLATGRDVIADVIRVACGEAVGAAPAAHQAASIRFVVASSPGRIARLTQPAEPFAARLQWYVATGSEVAIAHDFRDRLGHVIACGPDAASAAASADAALGQLAVQIEAVLETNTVS